MVAERSLSIVELYEDHKESLKLSWVAAVGVDRQVMLKDMDVYGPDAVGHFNLIYNHRIQVIGNPERVWFERVGNKRWQRQIEEMIDAEPPALIVADDIEIPSVTQELCETTRTPLFVSPKSGSSVIDLLHLYLARRFADTLSMHGVFMDVFGLGVLITGDSGSGKSELALELISRGHGLVADDVVEFARVTPSTIEGKCPGILMDYLEVRGLGLLNIRTIFGETAARRKMDLNMIVHLQRTVTDEQESRLPSVSQTQEVLGIAVHKVVLSVVAGRNLAVLLEAAVRNCILQRHGIDSMSEFINRQQRTVLDNSI